MENLMAVVQTRAVTPYGIASGRISASNQQFVEEMPRIQPGQNSRSFLATDIHRSGDYRLKYNKRKVGLRPKQTITGLRRFFQEHGLQAGDLITLYKEEGDEMILMGQLISPLYVIHFEKVNEVAGQ